MFRVSISFSLRCEVGEAQSETQDLVLLDQTNQQAGDQLVLFVELRALTKTGLTDAKRKQITRPSVAQC